MENYQINSEYNAMADKYSIKNLLFYRAIPPCKLPEVADGYKLFNCTDCGDRFVFESSYNHHISRKSVKITYKCRHCTVPQRKVYYNRCNLLSHIRSHSFKTATINVSDLKIEPLPLNFFKKTGTTSPQKTPNASNATLSKPSTTTCNECNETIKVMGPIYKDRASHYMKFTYGSEVHSCPICLFTLPTVCALKAHLRIHLRIPPFFCPECGCYLSDKIINYPYNHNCEGFNMMRATARLKCPTPQCNLTHPNDFKQHMKVEHFKKVYKCPLCAIACFNEVTIGRHVITHHHQQSNQMSFMNNIVIFYQCELCPGRLVLQSHLNSHLNSHINNHVYPCWVCGAILDDVAKLVDHHIDNHMPYENTKEMYRQLRRDMHDKESGSIVKIYRVVKKCDQCLRSFTYKCTYNEINILPNVCPYKCNYMKTSMLDLRKSTDADTQIICTFCNNKINQKWEDVKAHYAVHHKEYKCLDIKISLDKLDINKYTYKTQKSNAITRKKRQKRKKVKDISNRNEEITLSNPTAKSNLACSICQQVSETKEELGIHIRNHRDPCMAYQCLECGQSFVVKPSFTTHLLLEHGISEVDNYILEKKCYNDNALTINPQIDDDYNLPLEENQCKICRDRFDNSDDLEKHFRVHGMAFLKQNSQNKHVAS